MKIVELTIQYYGHRNYLWTLLTANGLSEPVTLHLNDQITFPPRGDRRNLLRAQKRLGYADYHTTVRD